MTGATMKRLVGIICLVLGFAANASAASIAGTFNFAGAVIVTATTINWLDDTGANPDIPNAITTLAGAEGFFAGMPSGSNGSYASSIDLVAPQQTQVGFLHDFEEDTPVANVYDDLSFNLTDIIEPTAAPCVANTDYASGQSCSLGVFTLTATSGSSTAVTMDIRGEWVHPSYTTTPAKGLYTADRTADHPIYPESVRHDGAVQEWIFRVYHFGPGTCHPADVRRRHGASGSPQASSREEEQRVITG